MTSTDDRAATISARPRKRKRADQSADLDKEARLLLARERVGEKRLARMQIDFARVADALIQALTELRAT